MPVSRSSLINEFAPSPRPSKSCDRDGFNRLGFIVEGSTFTLPRFYREVYSPTYLVDARPRTFEAYNDAVSLWSRFVDDVPLCSIDVITLAKFKSALMSGRSPATVNKHLGAINAILTKAGPPGPRNRDALGILDRVPWVKPLKELQRSPTLMSFESIASLYHAAGNMRLPEVPGVAAPAWWRALIVLAYTCALRRGTLLAIRWRDVDLDHGLLTYDGDADKAGRARAKPLHRVAIEHLRAIVHPGENIFGWKWATQQIAERGPMPLHLADVHLHHARMFRDRDELVKAAHLIRSLGYGRRYDELADAKAALGKAD